MSTATEDAHAQELMAKWDSENPVDETGIEADDVDEPLGYDDMLEQYRRTVVVTDNAFDHFVLGTSDLDQAVEDFEKLTGVRPLMVVSHNGCGTKSARVAFEQCAFIEFLAPDPKQDVDAWPLAKQLSQIPAGELVPVHYAVRTTDAEELRKTVWEGLELETDNVTMIAKDRGMPWKWCLYFFEGHNGLTPFFADWGDAHHAAGRLPIVGSLTQVTVRAPASHKVHKLLDGVKDLTVETGDEFFECNFTSAKGTHSFSGKDLFGISFPK